MWMDIAIGLIFVLSTASGFRKGFVRTFIHTAGWVLSIIVGFVFFSRVENFLRANTNFYDNIYNKISGQIEAGGSSAIHTLTTDMPLILQEVIDSIKVSVTTAIASGIADFVFKILCFILVVIIIRLVFCYSLLFSAKTQRRNYRLSGWIFWTYRRRNQRIAADFHTVGPSCPRHKPVLRERAGLSP